MEISCSSILMRDCSKQILFEITLLFQQIVNSVPCVIIVTSNDGDLYENF